MRKVRIITIIKTPKQFPPAWQAYRDLFAAVQDAKRWSRAQLVQALNNDAKKKALPKCTYSKRTTEYWETMPAAGKRSSAPRGYRIAHLHQWLSQQITDSKFAARLAAIAPPAPATISPRSPSRVFGFATIPTEIDHIIEYASADLIGREREKALLSNAWGKTKRHELKRPHILTFVALGGGGKTSLVAKWLVDEMLAKGWPGCDAAFAWSFYNQGTRKQLAASSDLFLEKALTFFGDDTDKQFAASNAPALEKGQRLARIVGQRRSLLILDGIEPLQYPSRPPHDGRLKDDGLVALLKGLATSNNGLCVITTRYAIPDLRVHWQGNAPMHELPRLSRADGVKLLKSYKAGPEPNPVRIHGKQAEFEKLVEDVRGHALTLRIVGQFLVRAFRGDIRCHDRVKFEKADAKIQGGHAFRVMEAYVKWLEDDSDEARREVALLKLLGLFDRPATADCVNILRQAPAIPGLTEPLVGLAEDDWEFSLTSLRDAKLLMVNRAEGSGELIALDAHPLVREYFAQRVHQQQPEAWRAAHRRLYEHLCVNTPDKLQPTLEDLQPLYQAVAHGCQAGLHQEAYDKVYRVRIVRPHACSYFSSPIAGSFGSQVCVLTCFFDVPWSNISPLMAKNRRSELLFDVGTALRAVGQETEAVKVTQLGFNESVKAENWEDAAWGAANLSELSLTLGKVADAVQQAHDAVTYAKRGPSIQHLVVNLTLHADALHQAGSRRAAERLFGEAAALQNKHDYNFPPLVVLGYYPYYELLLAGSEHAAWRYILRRPLNTNLSSVLKPCRAVAMRAPKELERLIEAGPTVRVLTCGLQQLAIGNASLYESILMGSPPDRCRLSLQNAVDFLRREGDSTHLPRALFARAWMRFLTGARAGAQDDLDESWEIAERGPMPLFLADIHLHRARLFFREKEYPKKWISPQADLAAAEKRINDCGYHRRDEELADAKRTILGP